MSQRSTATTIMMNIELLLRAAKFLDEPPKSLDSVPSDHGYATSKNMYAGVSTTAASGRQQRKSRAKSNSWSRSLHVGGRSQHNEMEKNRRANLRHCLERLKSAIPEVRGEASKNTTLQLLKRARQCILSLEQQQQTYERTKSDLLRQRSELNRMLQTSRSDFECHVDDGRHRLRSSSGSSSSDSGRSSYRADYLAYRLRSVSDSTSPSPDSISSPTSASEVSDDVDIMGIGSDSDEYGH